MLVFELLIWPFSLTGWIQWRVKIVPTKKSLRSWVRSSNSGALILLFFLSQIQESYRAKVSGDFVSTKISFIFCFLSVWTSIAHVKDLSHYDPNSSNFRTSLAPVALFIHFPIRNSLFANISQLSFRKGGDYLFPKAGRMK